MQCLQVQELVQQTEMALGPVDILVNCAGVMYYTLMKNIHQDEWDRTIDINCKVGCWCDWLVVVGWFLLTCSDHIEITESHFAAQSLRVSFQDISPEKIFNFLKEINILGKIKT